MRISAWHDAAQFVTPVSGQPWDGYGQRVSPVMPSPPRQRRVRYGSGHSSRCCNNCEGFDAKQQAKGEADVLGCS